MLRYSAPGLTRVYPQDCSPPLLQLQKATELLDGLGSDSSAKLVYLARHGEGVHNVADHKYGKVAWEEHWAKLFGDGTMTWGPDPELTERGVMQAQDVHERLLALGESLPRPTAFYSSPFTRALETLHIEWSGLLSEKPVIVVEDLRETIGKNTCDMRSTRSCIQARFPNVVLDIEEEDNLWTPERETDEAMRARVHRAMDRIWVDSKDDRGKSILIVVSITVHGGVIQRFFEVLGGKGELPVGGTSVLTGYIPNGSTRRPLISMSPSQLSHKFGLGVQSLPSQQTWSVHRERVCPLVEHPEQ